MLSRNTIRQFLAIGVVLGIFVVAVPDVAAIQILPNCAVTATGQGQAPDLNCALQTFGNIAQLILGVTGSFALLMFVYAGFQILTAAGDDSKITSGKTTLRNAVIGILIIFSAGYLVDYGVNQIRSNDSVNTATLVTRGTACETENGSPGQAFEGIAGGACITSCETLPGYACMTPPQGAEATCLANLCAGPATIRCCPQ